MPGCKVNLIQSLCCGAPAPAKSTAEAQPTEPTAAASYRATLSCASQDASMLIRYKVTSCTTSVHEDKPFIPWLHLKCSPCTLRCTILPNKASGWDGMFTCKKAPQQNPGGGGSYVPWMFSTRCHRQMCEYYSQTERECTQNTAIGNEVPLRPRQEEHT